MEPTSATAPVAAHAAPRVTTLPLSKLESDRIQTLRGIACVLLVAYHVIGDNPARGLYVADDSIYKILSNIFIHLRMPLFTFLSGFVYAYRPILPGSSGVFARKKLRRLVVPLIVVSTLYFVVQQAAPGTNTKAPWSSIWQIYVFPYDHFWFLQAIIIIFAVTLIVERLGWLQTFNQYLLVFALTLLIHFSVNIEPNIFSIQKAIYLAPFFLAGIGANRFHVALWDRRLKVAMLLAAAGLFVIHVLGCLRIAGEPLGQGSVGGTILSLASIFTLMYWVPANQMLGWLGGFSFAIYLYHVFFTAGVRIVLFDAGVDNLPLHALLGLAAGVMGPVIFEIAIQRSTTARRLLLGQS